MSKFEVGQRIQVGTAEHPPGLSPVPYFGRVICTDSRNWQDLCVLVLVEEEASSNNMESMQQFREDGTCFGKQVEYNLYPIQDADVSTQPVK